MIYTGLFWFVLIAFLCRRIFRYLISTEEMKNNNKHIETLKNKIKLNPEKKKFYQGLIMDARFGNLHGGLKFVFLDLCFFFFFIIIARMLFNTLDYWLIIYICSMIILGIIANRIKRRFNIKWL